MPPFNQPVQQQNPEQYTNLSRPVQAFEGNQAGKYLYGGLGKVLDESVEAADMQVKKLSSDILHSKVDPLTDAFTSSLEEARQGQIDAHNQPSQGLPADPLWQQQQYGVDVPQGVKDGLNTVATLTEGKNQRQMSETYYLGQVNAAIKEVRAQFPGYRDWIDQRAHEITGHPIANQYIQSLIGDINKNREAGSNIQNKVLGMFDSAIKDGVPGAADHAGMFIRGSENYDQAMHWINDQYSWKYKFEAAKAGVWAQGQDEEATKKSATQYLNQRASWVSANAMHEVMLRSGIRTNDDYATVLAKLGSGEMEMQDKDAENAGKLLQTGRQLVFQQLWSEANTPGPDGKTLIDKMGGDPGAVETLINKQMAGMDNFVKAFLDKDSGWAFYHEHMNHHMVNDRENGWYRDPDVGDFNLSTAALAKSLGPASSWANSFVASQFATNAPKEEAAFSSFHKLKMFAQPDPRNLYTAQDAINETHKAGITTPAVYDDYINQVKWIADKKTPDAEKINGSYAFFDPKNRDLLDSFKKEYRDPQTGRMVPAKYSVFTRLTSPDITHEEFRLGKQDPKVWENYKNWAETSFGFKLFSEEIKNLNTVSLDKGAQIRYVSQGDTHKFVLDNVMPTGPYQLPDSASRFRMRVQDSLDHLNGGLNSLANIAKVEHSDQGDIDAYLMKVLAQEGYDPTTTAGVPGDIVRAIISSRPPRGAKSMEDTFEGK